MRLYEEYFKRHGMSVPLVHHCTQGSLILRTPMPDWATRWVLVSLRWQDHPQHPGSYVIEYSVPAHDGELANRLFAKLPTIKKEWDEYEDHIFQWAADLKGAVPVRGKKNVMIAAWEMFVFCYDSWFRRQSYEIKEMLFRSLDDESPVDERYAGFQDIILHLSTHHPAVLKAWKYEVLAEVQHYSDWLAELIDAERIR